VPVVRTINRLHHLDEARHLAFGRRVVSELLAQHAAAWPQETSRRIRCYLADYLAAVRREYVNPDVYRDAGLADPLALRAMALGDPGRQTAWHDLTSRCRAYLSGSDMLEKEPHA
jgi:hypothetical protein